MIDVNLVQHGAQVSQIAASDLIKAVTHEEIREALSSIDESKAPSIDGFNSLFFKKAWHIIKFDIYNAVNHFFDTTEVCQAINCTLITLVPKVYNPSYVKYFRLIACCTVVYKIIAKILTRRMQSMISDVIDLARAGFMPERNITDNILLAT